MKLVIDISEKDYNYAKKQVADGITNPWKMCIVNGTPLPKGHGRLIDAERYRKEMLDSREFNFFKTLDMQQTIIEADKAESEEV